MCDHLTDPTKALIVMASTPQPTFPLDFETALAKFVTRGPINTQDTLEEAILELLIAMQAADSEVSSLLVPISLKIHGLLEAVITSRTCSRSQPLYDNVRRTVLTMCLQGSDLAFTLRGRVLQAVQKTSRLPNPIFTTCAERLGAFFLRLPRSLTLDHDVITKHLSFLASLASPNSSESEYFIAKKVKPVVPTPPKPPKPSKSGKRKTRFVPLDMVTEGAPKTKSGRKGTAQVSDGQPPSPTPIPGGSDPASNLSEQLRECLQVSVIHSASLTLPAHLFSRHTLQLVWRMEFRKLRLTSSSQF